MSAVLKLAYEESVRLDRSQLEVLYQSLGPVGADKVVNHALEEISISLTRGMKEYRDGRLDELRATMRGLVAVAQQVGMMTLARVGRDVQELTMLHDPAALGATIARLARIGETSLVAVWDLQDLSV